MSKKTLALFVAATLAAPAVMAREHFTGLGASAELQFKSTGFQISQTVSEISEAPSPSFFWSTDVGGEQDVIGAVNLRYGFNLSQSFVLQIGGTYDLGKTNIEDDVFIDINDSANNYSCQARESNHYSLYLAPGYRATPKTLVYAKVAYHSMKGKLSCLDNGGFFLNLSSRFNGLGLGMGVNTMLTDNIFLYAEAQHVMYREKTFSSIEEGDPSYLITRKLDPASTIGSIGIGINF